MGEENVKEALENIKQAEASGDEETLHQYSMDERKTVHQAAQKALDKLETQAFEGVDEEEDGNLADDVKSPEGGILVPDRKSVDQSKWVKVTHEEMMKLQEEHRLIGYDPATGKALFK